MDDNDADILEREILEDDEDIELEDDEDEENLGDVVVLVVEEEELSISCELKEEKLWGLLVVDLLLLDDEYWVVVEEKLNDEDETEGENIDVEIDELVEDVEDNDEVRNIDEALVRCNDELLDDGADIIALFEEVVLCIDDPSELINNEEELCCSACIVWLLFPLLLIFWADEHDNKSRCIRNFLFSKSTIMYQPMYVCMYNITLFVCVNLSVNNNLCTMGVKCFKNMKQPKKKEYRTYH